MARWYQTAMIFTLLLAASIVPPGQAFDCTPTAVWDGDGPIWCAEGPHIRLSGIATREMDGTCRPGHPCPAADPITSRDHLVGLLGNRGGVRPTGHVIVVGPVMRCMSAGSAGGKSHGCFLQFAPIGRYFLRDGARWLCREMGSVLARSSLQLTPSI